jgi:predicted nucleic acid-binding protein
LAALVDTGPLVAVFARRDRSAARYRAVLERANEEAWLLATTWPCVVEASHILDAPERYTMLRWIASGAVQVYGFEVEQLDEMVDLMERHTERPGTEMDLADASLVRLATETGVTTIMTLDVRDFSRYRLPDGRAFEII